ncbi:NACHT domain-containing protein [uncultured Thiodictyon sp.]|uniref:NACHT domain-containing protein n=1 Tax=uncultured Thiodictyon sp. TaxID=1846217 RepID=UPI0025FBD2B1|nr:NACHT domain-containing protein [uncultured Thiodictyon sp.]
MRLHWLVDCAEIAVRWSVAVALAQVLRANAGDLPGPLAERLREHIERPTLGRWLGILEHVSAARPTGALLAPGVFDLYGQVFAPRFRGEGQGGTLDNSILLLRNHLAHGAGLRSEAARALLDAHEPGVFDLLRAVALAGAGTQVIALAGERAERLAGPRPCSIPRPAALQDCADGPWLVSATGALPLLPLASFGPVRLVSSAGRLEERPGNPAAQLYQRADRERLAYVPLGRDEAVSLSFDVDAFRALFRLDSAPAGRTTTGEVFHWTDFLREARVLQEDLVGRVAELAALKTWLKGRDTRREDVAGLGLVFGGPGVGKSLLMARLAADLGNSKPEQQGLYYHRFRAGDARNNTRAFLLGLLAALADWAPLPAASAERNEAPDTDQALLEAVRERLAAVAGLEPAHPQAQAPRFLVLADGLDEVLPYEPRLAQRLRGLTLPGTVWLLASRPEPALTLALGGAGCETVFPDGLPSMSAADIRAMLLEGLASARHALISRDQDAAEGVSNPFVERVVACAAGLPLYVHLLLEDLRNGQLSVRDEQRLPQGLVAYYDELMNRVGLSDLKRDLPLLVACLARAEEPLDAEALALLLADVSADAQRYRERVQNAVRAGQALLRGAPTPDGTLGLTLYHQSFRDYVGGRPDGTGQPAVPPAPALAGTVVDAEAKLYRLAQAWTELPRGGLRNHLFRWGVRYALRWQGEAGIAAARRRLTDFVFLQAFTAELPSSAVRGLVADYETLLARLPDGPERQEFRLWEAFFREREHILRRGDERWPAYKILLQLAVEHADDSPVTGEAERIGRKGQNRWPVLRTLSRPRNTREAVLRRRLLGHSFSLMGIRQLKLSGNGRRLASIGGDCTARVWDIKSATLVATFNRGTQLDHIAVCADGSVCVVSENSGSIYIWRTGDADGAIERIDHSLPIVALEISSCGTWCIFIDAEGTIRKWSLKEARNESYLKLNTRFKISEAVFLQDGHAIAIANDNYLELWDLDSRHSKRWAIPGHGLFPIRGNRILRTSGVWDLASGNRIFTLKEYGYWTIDPSAVAADPGGNKAIAYVSGDIIGSFLGVWDAMHGKLISTIQATPPNGFDLWPALAISNDEQYAFLGGKSDIAIFPINCSEPAIGKPPNLPEHLLATARCTGQVFSAGYDKTVKAWHGYQSSSSRTLLSTSPRIQDLAASEDGSVVACLLFDRSVRIIAQEENQAIVIRECTAKPHAIAMTPDGRHILVANGNHIDIWRISDQKKAGRLSGHAGEIMGIAVNGTGKTAVSCDYDGSLRAWDLDHNQCVAEMFTPQGAAFLDVAISHSGAFAVSAGHDGVLVWDMNTYCLAHKLSGLVGVAVTVAISTDDTLIASRGNEELALTIWRLPDTECYTVWESLSRVMQCESVGPSRFVVSDDDGKVTWLEISM